MRKSQRKITYIPETGDLDANYCTGRELMDATKTVVSTLSRNHETSVTFGGDEAYTTGKHVVLPSLPDDAQVTKRQGLVTGGYANHETLHNLLTEFDGETRDMCQRWHRNEMHLTNSIANAMEDVRIEMGGRDLYNGLPKAIDKTAHEVNQQFLDEHLPTLTDEELNDFTRIGAVAITWEGRKRLGYPSDTMQKCLDAVSDDVKRKASMIVDAIQHLGTGVEGMVGSIPRPLTKVVVSYTNSQRRLLKTKRKERTVNNVETLNTQARTDSPDQSNLPQMLRVLLEENGAVGMAKSLAMLEEREIKELLEVLQMQMQQALLDLAIQNIQKDNQIKALKQTVMEQTQTKEAVNAT